MGFVGLLGADNARERIEGVKETIKGSKIQLVDVRGDEIDQTRAKRNVEDVLAATPDVACLVGFYSYNTPRIYEVLKETNASSTRSRSSASMKTRSRSAASRTAASSAPSCSSRSNGAIPQGHEADGRNISKATAKSVCSAAGGIIIVPGKVIGQSDVDDFMALARCGKSARRVRRKGQRRSRGAAPDARAVP